VSIKSEDDIITLLVQDHHTVEQTFDEITDAGVEQRGELFWRLTEQLVRHEVAEEIVLYPEIRRAPTDRAVACPHRRAVGGRGLPALGHLQRPRPSPRHGVPLRAGHARRAEPSPPQRPEHAAGEPPPGPRSGHRRWHTGCGGQ